MENNKIIPFQIETVRSIQINPETRIHKTMIKALGFESHNNVLFTVIVSSDKISLKSPRSEGEGMTMNE